MRSNSRPSLKALEVFEAVARHQSFCKASEELCINHSGVSKHIKSLELHFEKRLLVRNNKQVQLTDSGQRLWEQLTQAFEIIRGACGIPHEKNFIEIKVPVTFAIRWMLPRLSRIREETELNLKVTTAWRHSVDFLKEHYDMGIIFCDDPSEEFFYEENLVAVCSKDYYEQLQGLSDQEIMNQANFISPNPSMSDWELFFSHTGLSSAQISADRMLIMDSMESAITAAVKFSGVAITDVLYVQNELAGGQLINVFSRTVKTGLGYKLTCVPSLRDSREYETLQEWITREANSQPARILSTEAVAAE
ncbi:Transcriptional regulator [Hahella chejuensis KCTC 2396]|uniref:Transcriptional regulator n=1 Tax=Hahella chejuensis (strain KCTC 2396) TaxID=349521 RepID=Q2SFZ0_HAHCH|nr:LysR family transcriptional regulator [Hahella chejuensis]ABC30434.1 Transcriptional regulator [Hahella chejuensis KCTC 2396]